MFGYITPLVCELKVKEHNLYKTIYCGLCRSLKKNYNSFFTSFLSYDLVFFAIMSISFFDDNIEFEKKFCPVHPFKKKICLKNCDSLTTAADLTIIFSYFKLKDQIADEKFFKKSFAKILLCFFNGAFKKASNNQQYFTKIIENFVNNQKKIEIKKTKSIDEACHPTAECLALLFEKFTSNVKQKEYLYRFGYLLGRFIYLIDAVDDLENDLKSKNFNPFLKNCSTSINNNQKNEIFDIAFSSINFTISQIIDTYSQIKIVKLKPIIDNIVFFGLKSTQKRIFKKHNKSDMFEKVEELDPNNIPNLK